MEYVTEKSMVDALVKIHQITSMSVSVQHKMDRRRVDAVVLDNSTVVHGFEFDGLFHYTSTNQAIKDEELDQVFGALNSKVVRWPYWIQPRVETVEWAFGRFANSEILEYVDGMNFPHGFISKEPSCVLPADFCEFGWKRFVRELDSLPSVISIEVLSNLRIRSDKCRIAKASITGIKEKAENFSAFIKQWLYNH